MDKKNSMKLFIISGFCLYATHLFSQQTQSQNRVVNLTNILVQNVSNVNLNNNENNVQMLSNPKPRTRVNRPNVNRVYASNAIKNTYKASTISQVRRVARKPITRPVRRVTTATPTIQPPDNIINESAINNINKLSQNISLTNNSDIQVKNFISDVSKNPQKQFINIGIGNQLNLSVDLSLNVNTKSTVKYSSSSAGSTSHSKSRTFGNKMAKFKRNFFGKLSLHKKSKHRIDICFVWKS